MKKYNIVIVGGGYASANFVSSLRDSGFDGSIILISEESHAPYHRAKLSKSFLNIANNEAVSPLKAVSFYADKKIDTLLQAEVVSVDRMDQSVKLRDGSSISYDTLVLATGSLARRISIENDTVVGIHYLRGAHDAQALRSSIGPGRKLAVIGGGFIGLEVAASVLACGGKVVLIEREGRMLSRVASAPIAEFLTAGHNQAGLETIVSANVVAFEETNGVLCALRLDNGTTIDCEAALICVGSQVNDRLAREAGVDCDDGVLVDDAGRSSDSAIFAIGDVARTIDRRSGRGVRQESIANAIDAARRCAAAIAGLPLPPQPLPSFWSEQGAFRLQIIGIPEGSCRTVVRDGVPDGAIVVDYLDEQGRLRGVEAVNAPTAITQARGLIERND